MADQLLVYVQDLVEGQIDFAGQKKTETITTLLLAISGVVAFIIGYIQENIHLTLWIGLFGAFLTAFIVVPPWPAFNEEPAIWLPAGSQISGSGIEVDGKKIN